MDQPTIHYPPDEKPPQKKDFQPTEKTSRWQKIKKTLLSKPPKKRLIIISGVGAILVAGAFFGWFWQYSHQPEPIEYPEIVIPEPEEPVDTRVQSPLTGNLVTPELAARQVTGVMIENSIDARPQSGLEEAGVVFEAIAEGGITRFLALFQEQMPANIGPIRSARPYYVEWAKGFDAAYVHSGGSGEALALIRSLGVKDLDHGAFGNSLAQRVSWRFAPHNVYTSSATIDTVAISQGYTKSEFTPFARLDERDPETVNKQKPDGVATSIVFDISSANYNTSYSYDSNTKLYPRTMAQRPHTDKDSGKQISPRVIVALQTTYGIHPNRIHSIYGTVGTGNITVFQNGEVYSGSWRKTSQSASLELLDTSGQPLKLAPGQTWITAIPAGRLSYN